MNYRTAITTGIILAALAVMIGAFGAHALKATLMETGRADTYELAVRYQFYHALAIIITGLLMKLEPEKKMKWAPLCFMLGTIIFSGSLYILSITGITLFGAITPIGGLLFIAGWLVMLIGFLRNQR